jgi:LysR family hydrogen peroxide-inducible transcriptional activator
MTTQGTEVVERARVILRDLKDLVGSTHYEGDQLRGRIGLGVIPTLAPYVLPNVVRFVMSTHPKAELHIHELQTIHLLDSLRRGVIDLGLLALPVGSEEFTTESIGLDSFVLAMSESHPLAKEKSPVKLDVLRDERVILLEEGHCLRDQVTQVCRLVFSEPSEVQATSMATLAQMVAAGLGVTLLPECAVKIEAAPGRGIVTRKFVGVPPNRTVGLVWRKSSPHSRAFTELAELLTNKK